MCSWLKNDMCKHLGKSDQVWIPYQEVKVCIFQQFLNIFIIEEHCLQAAAMKFTLKDGILTLKHLSKKLEQIVQVDLEIWANLINF